MFYNCLYSLCRPCFLVSLVLLARIQQFCPLIGLNANIVEEYVLLSALLHDQGFSLIDSLQHFESFDEGHIFSTVHSMSSTFRESLQSGQPSIQISWRLHDGAICD